MAKQTKLTFKEHFQINGGIFKTSEEEVEEYAYTNAIQFAAFVTDNAANCNFNLMSPDQQFNIYLQFINNNHE